MSLSGPGFSQPFQDLINDLRAQGSDLVAAAGNRRPRRRSIPASFAGVISVSAVGPTRALAPYSNYGSTIDVAAPGGDFQRDVDGDGYLGRRAQHVLLGRRGFGYAFYQGTSMASAARVGRARADARDQPALTPADIDNR
jgi:serine protease